MKLKDGKGIIREFLDNGLLYFEGEYSNGKWNGQGKGYNFEGKLVFEGQYLNGKWNGQGKEYNYKGKLVFEGEFLNGKRWNGNLYDDELKSIEYVNGERKKNEKNF